MSHYSRFLKTVLFGWGLALLGASPAFPVMSCKYHRDAQGIVHLRASDSSEAFACVGYFHGFDRGWQVDYFRRIGQGRSAEALGAGQIRIDYFLRLMDLEAEAHRLYLGLDSETRKRIDAYAMGVTQGISDALKQGVYEFERLDYHPDPFLPEHALLVLLVQSFDQTRRAFEYRIDEYRIAEKRGSDWIKLKRRSGLPWEVSVLDEKYVRLTHKQTLPQQNLEVYRESDSTGSNNWVVAKTRSKSGHAWLANDPHLDLKTPSFWYWIDVESPEERKIGATVPGFPQVVSGTNGKLAWGLTNAYLDYADVALVDEAELDAAIIERPTIWFKWWKLQIPFFFKTLRKTKNGSVVLPIDAPKGKAFVMHWGGVHYEPGDFEAVLRFSRSKTIDEMNDALAKTKISGWNFVFADQSGRIGYRATGRAFRRTAEVSFGVQNRKLDELESQSFLSESEMPNLIDPPSGFISTANNRQFPDEAGLYGGRAYSAGFRAYRIRELLNERQLHDFESIKRVQCDTQAVDARFLLPGMLSVLKNENFSQHETGALSLLTSWKYDTGSECTACAIYRRWVDRTLTGLEVAESGLYRLLTSQSREDIVRPALVQSFQEAVRELLKIGQGTFPTWERMHRVFFPHLSGAAEFARAESLFTPGDMHSVNVGTTRWRGDHYEHTSGASQRVVIELSNPVRIHYRLPGTNPSCEPVSISSDLGPWKEWTKCSYVDEALGLDWASVELKNVQLGDQ